MAPHNLSKDVVSQHRHPAHVMLSGRVQPAPAAVAEEEDEGEVDETGVEPKDVELVMTQVPPPPPPGGVMPRHPQPMPAVQPRCQ